MQKFLYLFSLLLFSSSLFAQNELSETSHKLLGANVAGYQVNIPFGKEVVSAAWESYAKDFGRSEPTQDHKTYQTTFKPSIYNKEVLVFAQITGDKTSSKLWAAIDPQGIPKDTLKLLQDEMRDFVYGFNIKVRKDAAQKKIDESEQAATYLSKEYEELKRDERKNQRNYEKTNERIVKYEQELVELRQDSNQYNQNLQQLSVKLDSVYSELEKIKSMVELYKQKMEGIE
ncbi:hypothetical protein GCM10027429_03530 [Marivirga atlantica]|jgi:hypothetical protein|uniref:DUF4468 domain-containing protein n=1 Tax=Marivirga atlantica TaxID=1548457 RepID=A0A937AC75_9BACT|nr:hypothetical protein [Marivirga atlantica]MBL0763966.1 hypothetical protein [Marivirga atlantica]